MNNNKKIKLKLLVVLCSDNINKLMLSLLNTVLTILEKTPTFFSGGGC